MTARPEYTGDEIEFRVKAGEDPGDWAEGFDIVGVSGDDEYDYFTLRRRND